MTLRRFAIAGVLLSTVGCMSIQPVASINQFIPQKSPEVVYVTYTDNSMIPLAQPRISGDSLLGVWQGLAEPVGVPLRDVKLVRARQRDKTKTTLMAIGLGGVGAIAMVAILTKVGNAPPPCSQVPQPGLDPC